MTLSAKVQARYADAELITLTNHGTATSASTLNTTRLTAACDDAEAEFEMATGVEYDDDDAKHVAVAVLAADWKLIGLTRERSAQRDAARVEFLEAAARLAATVGGRARILPQTSSTLTPSVETPDGYEVRPDFDRANLGGALLRSPRGPSNRDARPED